MLRNIRCSSAIHKYLALQNARKCGTVTVKPLSQNAIVHSTSDSYMLPNSPSCARYFRRNFCKCLPSNGREMFDLDTKPFGRICIQTDGPVATRISPVDPHKYPLQDKVLVRVDSADEDGVDLERVISVEAAEGGAHTDGEDTVTLTASAPHSGHTVSCHIQVPIKFGK